MDTVLILTPVKNATGYLDRYFTLLKSLTYPHNNISLGILETDSHDRTYARAEKKLPGLQSTFKKCGLWKRDFGFSIPAHRPRWASEVQVERRSVMAKSRNYLLFRALADEDWVLWLDVDVREYPPDIIQRLLSTGKNIVQPHCVLEYGGKSFDLNAWRDKGRYHLHDLRTEGDMVKLDAVGGTMLLIKADLHREGLIFPPFLFKSPMMRTDNGFYSRLVAGKTAQR